ncbi:MAG: PDZ domain-containing protein [Phycisphaerales bacterium]|nr:PDZ domain-containing protein [Phycisphaerales bacterium]
MRSATLTSFLPAVAASLLVASSATAQTLFDPPSTPELRGADELDPRIVELVAQLGDPTWSRRERAEATLLELRVPVEQLVGALEQSSLDVEQRHRLLAIVRDRILSMPRGALGIRMEPRLGEFGGVVIVSILPGMPAEGQLAVGDRIVEIDGQPIVDSSTLIQIVQMKAPGDTVAMAIGRPRKGPDGRELRDQMGQPVFDEIRLDLELGSVEDLTRFDDGRTSPLTDPVTRLRAEQAREAGLRFAPRRMAVPIEGRNLAASTDALDVDAHSAVATLLTYRRLLAEGAMRVSPELRSMWRATLQQLQEQAEDPGLPGEMRDYLRAVAKRYKELVPE